MNGGLVLGGPQGFQLSVKHRRRAPFWVCAAFLLASACGSSDDNGPPDTGYGAKAVVPSSVTCEALCAREADCLEHLCNEDTASSRYTGLGSLIAGQCQASCTPALLSPFTADSWSCLFQSSCRAAVGHDVCHVSASYYCQ